MNTLNYNRALCAYQEYPAHAPTRNRRIKKFCIRAMSGLRSQIIKKEGTPVNEDTIPHFVYRNISINDSWSEVDGIIINMFSLTTTKSSSGGVRVSTFAPSAVT